MKKNLITTFSIILFAFASLTGCKKDFTQSTPAKNAGEMNDLEVGNNSSCKVTQIVWDYLFTWDFHYNDKGLADEWRIDYGGGFAFNYKMKYDKFDKLIEVTGYDDFHNLVSTYYFTYDGNRVTSQKWTDLLAGTSGEVLFSYNSKGQIVRTDDGDTHQLMYYDNKGNSILSDYYIGNDLWFSDRYEFNNLIRNPLLTVSGVDFMFPYYGVGYFNKLWFSRNLSIIYDSDGNPFVINDLNTSKTDISTGKGNFPTSINYYDTVSHEPLYFTFGYSCNGNSLANRTSPQNNRNKFRPLLFRGSAKSIKEQLQELRKLYTADH
jgi:hypothetical protein